VIEQAEKRGRILKLLERALELADEIEDGDASYMIERAVDVVRARMFAIIARQEG
jgi:hypothetical protein